MPVSNAPKKKLTDLPIDQALVTEARQLKVDPSDAAEKGIRHAIARTRAERWKEENREAIESSNAYVEKHGLPLAGRRPF